jgi:nucleolar protein 56
VVKLAKTPFGFFAIEEPNQIVDVKKLPKDAKKAAEALTGDDFKEWKKGISKKYDVETGLMDPLQVASLIGIKRKDYLEFARKVELEAVRIQLKGAIGKDYIVIQAVAGLDDLNKSINIMINRIREWHGLHHPELKVEDHEKFLRLILKGERKESFGIELSENDKKALNEAAEMIQVMYKTKNRIEKYLEKLMVEVAPNLTALAGANLGARLIDRAGSLKNLAKLPASTIQVLGAERALFKHLQKGTPSPKHGVIFQHSVINRAPKAKRGKLARTLGAKLALSARVDYYSKELKPFIVKDWKERVKEVLS